MFSALKNLLWRSEKMKKLQATVIIMLIFVFSDVVCASTHMYDAGQMFFNRKSQCLTNDVLVLMYHKLSYDESQWGDFCMSPKQFEEELVNLKKENYVFYTASELMEAKPQPGKRIVVITFDDGYESDYIYALPILKRHNAKATFFVIGHVIGDTGYMTETQLKSLSAEECAEIGNHTYSLHEKSPEYVTKLYSSLKYADIIEQDFSINSEFIEKITGKKVTAVSYPYGIWSDAVDLKLKWNGLSVSFNSDNKVSKLTEIKKPLGRINKASKK